ncbi:hypothetical protein AB4440_24135 [Vibrio splendidus]|uniref:hypothetical protein n=1 Tax=Vibrio splendidus TaxID=29497 RepID=UPI000C8464CB|nr:hypothetical protein [Vibrio splendidus]PMP00345.1 hypothetical protein BCS97_24235 [Vibrio splendidus]PMP33624.1 hypothetical protein BCS89_23585 [Vibrio splendidus]PMP39753.1 hypothetical protein BCS88_23700 [Vibrio splendidus]PMP45897.1 hypothetical protein BCS87_23545 [Vibrio splendidus]PMP51484.1 hypothetical protein BCS83_19240 [Vibrio splendidus]
MKIKLTCFVILFVLSFLFKVNASEMIIVESFNEDMIFIDDYDKEALLIGGDSFFDHYYPEIIFDDRTVIYIEEVEGDYYELDFFY